MAKQWIELKTLGGGGQGKVSLVKPEGQKYALDAIIESIRDLQGSADYEVQRKARENLGTSLTKFIQDGPPLAAKKELINPNEESMLRLSREAEVYESLSDAHLLRILDKSIPENWIVTEYQPNGTLEHQIRRYEGDILGTLTALRPLVNVLVTMHEAHFVHRDFKPANIFIASVITQNRPMVIS